MKNLFVTVAALALFSTASMAGSAKDFCYKRIIGNYNVGESVVCTGPAGGNFIDKQDASDKPPKDPKPPKDK